MAAYDYPTTILLTEIAREVAAVTQMNDLVFRYMPTVNVESEILRWEQRDNYLGMQQLRGIGGSPNRVIKTGVKSYTQEPGYYGEYIDLDEVELTRRRQVGSITGRVGLTDLVAEATEQLVHRRINRIRYIAWTLFTTGTFSVSQEGGSVIHTDTYSVQTATKSVDWDTVATAVPIKDFQAVALKGDGYGVNFGAGATAVMNRVTFNKLMNVTNAADIGGRILSGNVPVLGLDDLNRVFVSQGLAEIAIYGDGYYTDAGVWTYYVPTDAVIFFGQRPGGDTIAEYRFTLNQNTESGTPQSGPITRVIDQGDKVIPRRVQVHDMHNGGPVIYHPASICILSV